jgi:hypothetical protein
LRKRNRVTGNTVSLSWSVGRHLNLDELPWIACRRSINHGAARDDAATGGDDIDDRNLFHDAAERV